MPYQHYSELARSQPGSCTSQPVEDLYPGQLLCWSIPELCCPLLGEDTFEPNGHTQEQSLDPKRQPPGSASQLQGHCSGATTPSLRCIDGARQPMSMMG